MAWVAPALRATGYVVTASNWNDVAYYNLRYLKGLDGAIALEDAFSNTVTVTRAGTAAFTCDNTNAGSTKTEIGAGDTAGGETNQLLFFDADGAAARFRFNMVTGEFKPTGDITVPHPGALQTRNTDDNYFMIRARLNGVGMAALAYVVSGTEPRFRLGTLNVLTSYQIISGGVITINDVSTRYKITVEGGEGAGADDLNTVNGGTDGDIIILTARYSGATNTVTVKDATGNIQCNGDFALDNLADKLMLIYDGDDAHWHELSRGYNAA